MQATLADFRLAPPTAPQTQPATYLAHNDPPDTHPTLLFDPPLETPVTEAPPPTDLPGDQATLARWIDAMCPVCYATEPNVPEHLLLAHPDTINDRLSELAADREPVPQTDAPEPTPDPEPTLFKETPTERVGQPMDGFNDPRECNDCGAVMSKGYAKIFASERGDLWCPDCKSRSERYSNEGGTFGGTDPSSVTGKHNPNSAARETPAWAAPEG